MSNDMRLDDKRRKHRRAIRVAAAFGVTILCIALWVIAYTRLASGSYMDTLERIVRNDAALLVRQADAKKYVERVTQICSSDSEDGVNSDELAKIVDDPSYQKMVEMLSILRIPHSREFFVVAPNEEGDALFMVADGSLEPGSKGLRPIGLKIESVKHFEEALHECQETGVASVEGFSLKGGLIEASVAALDENDPKSGFLVLAIYASDALTQTAAREVWPAVVMLAITLGVPISLVILSKKVVIEPVATVNKAIRAYTQDRLSGRTGTNHFSNLNLKGENELSDLVGILSEMEDSVASYEKDLIAITAEKERVNTELKVAAGIQESALPSLFPAYPERDEFDVYATMLTAREVGGDFYDHFLIDDDHLCIVMADVSDKGVPAALFMMTSKAVVANYVLSGRSPAQALAATNDWICNNNRSAMFVTVWVGVLEISTGILTAANAGHEYPIVTSVDGCFRLYKEPHGLVVGGIVGMPYQDYSIMLQPGSRVFVYTDGVPEATNAEGEMFGLERTVETLNRHNDGSVKEVLEGVNLDVDRFVGDAEQFDDMTMLCLEYRGVDSASRTE